jgi:hypothetical protein
MALAMPTHRRSSTCKAEAGRFQSDRTTEISRPDNWPIVQLFQGGNGQTVQTVSQPPVRGSTSTRRAFARARGGFLVRAQISLALQSLSAVHVSRGSLHAEGGRGAWVDHRVNSGWVRSSIVSSRPKNEGSVWYRAKRGGGSPPVHEHPARTPSLL